MASNLTLEGVRIIYRNFSGEEREYNEAGRRNFSVILHEDLAMQLIEDGWNVKPLKKRDDDEETRYHLPVAVAFGKFPPTLYMIQGKSMVKLDEETVGQLDYADLENVDLIIRPRVWVGRDGNQSVKAYLKSGYFTISYDELAKKYESLSDSGFAPF